MQITNKRPGTCLISVLHKCKRETKLLYKMLFAFILTELKRNDLRMCKSQINTFAGWSSQL